MKHERMNNACERTILWLLKLVSLLNSCFAQFLPRFFCLCPNLSLLSLKVSRGYSASLHSWLFTHLAIRPLQLPLILVLFLTLSPSLLTAVN